MTVYVLVQKTDLLPENEYGVHKLTVFAGVYTDRTLAEMARDARMQYLKNQDAGLKRKITAAVKAARKTAEAKRLPFDEKLERRKQWLLMPPLMAKTTRFDIIETETNTPAEITLADTQYIE